MNTWNFDRCPPTPPPSEASTVSLEEDRESIGSERYLEMTGNPVYRRESVTSEDNLNLESLDIDTGRSLWPVSENNPYARSNSSLTESDIGSFPAPPPLMHTFGRRTPEMVNPLNWERDLYDAIALPIGIRSELTRARARLMTFQPTYTFDTTPLSVESGLIIYNQLLQSELVRYFGVQLELVNLEQRGLREVSKLTVRIQELNSGVAIRVSRMLSSMNFEVQSTSHTYFDGWIGIRVEWSLRDPPIR